MYGDLSFESGKLMLVRNFGVYGQITNVSILLGQEIQQIKVNALAVEGRSDIRDVKRFKRHTCLMVSLLSNH